LRGKRQKVWIGRWLDDVIENGQIRRVHRSVVLGSLRELPTRKLAERELERRLADINNPRYRAKPAATFAQFAQRWMPSVLPQLKPSTAMNYRCHINRYLLPFFGQMEVRNIGPETVQRVVGQLKVSSKTIRNVVITFRSMWKSAKAWGYASHDALDGLVLPSTRKAERFYLTLDEVRRIIGSAEEPYRTFYWLAAETGARAGELCALRVEDMDLGAGTVRINQSVWRGKLQSPKSQAALRVIAISPALSADLAVYIQSWRPNSNRLLFATRNGTPWDANLLVKRKLHPLLKQLGIAPCGLHGFRHGNATLMDKLNVPVKVRQQRLGHTDARITLDTYTHAVTADERQFAGQLGEILCPNLPKKGEAGASHSANSGLVN